MITIPCPLCGSPRYDRLSSKGQFNFPTHVSICKDCGFVYLNPRWSKFEYEDFNSTKYGYFFGSKKKPKNHAKAKQITDRIGVHVANTILEVGAGDGRNLEYFRSVNPHARFYGIEISEECRSTLKQTGISLVARDVDEDWESGYASIFDIVILRHTLEHFLDPVHILKKVTNVLKKDGVVYIAVPDMLNPKPPLTDYWFRVVHVNYFSAETLKMAAQKASLQPIKLISENHELWGIFKRGKVDIEQHNTYHLQKKIIQSKLERETSISYRVNNLYQKIKRMLCSFS
ncbi:MAG: class I SAM-dependent methyltransferase [archaeon]